MSTQADKDKTIRVTLVKSPIGFNKTQKATVQALGLRKLHQTVEKPDNPCIRGMVTAISHLVQVSE